MPCLVLYRATICYFCNNSTETVIHFFCEWQIAKKKIWKPLIRWLDYFCYIQIDCDQPEIILLQMYNDSFRLMTNTIILIAKQYIYSAKC